MGGVEDTARKGSEKLPDQSRFPREAAGYKNKILALRSELGKENLRVQDREKIQINNLKYLCEMLRCFYEYLLSVTNPPHMNVSVIFDELLFIREVVQDDVMAYRESLLKLNSARWENFISDVGQLFRIRFHELNSVVGKYKELLIRFKNYEKGMSKKPLPDQSSDLDTLIKKREEVLNVMLDFLDQFSGNVDALLLIDDEGLPLSRE